MNIISNVFFILLFETLPQWYIYNDSQHSYQVR